MKKSGRFALLSTAVLILVAAASTVFGESTMVEKNLFAPDRKPPSPESMETLPQRNQQAVSIKAIQLDGVMIHGNTRKAIIRHKGKMPGSDGKKGESPYTTVHEGEPIGDYNVVKIDAKSIILEKDGKREEVGLFAEGKVVPPAPRLPSAPSSSAQQEQPSPANVRGGTSSGGQSVPSAEGSNPAPHLPPQNNANAGVILSPGGQPSEEPQQDGGQDAPPAEEQPAEGGAESEGEG